MEEREDSSRTMKRVLNKVWHRGVAVQFKRSADCSLLEPLIYYEYDVIRFRLLIIFPL